MEYCGIGGAGLYNRLEVRLDGVDGLAERHVRLAELDDQVAWVASYENRLVEIQRPEVVLLDACVFACGIAEIAGDRGVLEPEVDVVKEGVVARDPAGESALLDLVVLADVKTRP